ncbi:hypothetical protein E2C01_031900 [Portunus trituberculatus]|uniref:Uncharacterized protein n=1 Tax=Portunus trituberculatus TaxID=210409 RepID=A0A5B7F1B6_PORTR|nr:hypothetical protein [Portunus trituberculatus]
MDPEVTFTQWQASHAEVAWVWTSVEVLAERWRASDVKCRWIWFCADACVLWSILHPHLESRAEAGMFLLLWFHGGNYCLSICLRVLLAAPICVELELELELELEVSCAGDTVGRWRHINSGKFVVS